MQRFTISLDDGLASEFDRLIAERGYVTVTITYRLHEGAWIWFNSPSDVALGAARDARHDAQAAVRYLRANAAEYGMPQRRRRVFLLGYHKRTAQFKALRKSLPAQWLCDDGVMARAFPAVMKTGLSQFSIAQELDVLSKEFGARKGRSPFKNAGVMIAGMVFTGTVVLPIIHRAEIMDISVKSLDIDRRGKDGLICKDNIRADIKVAFFVRVNKTPEDVLKVAQSIGCARASDLQTLDELFSAKFSEALKTVGKQLEFEELYTRIDRLRSAINARRRRWRPSPSWGPSPRSPPARPGLPRSSRCTTTAPAPRPHARPPCRTPPHPPRPADLPAPTLARSAQVRRRIHRQHGDARTPPHHQRHRQRPPHHRLRRVVGRVVGRVSSRAVGKFQVARFKFQAGGLHRRRGRNRHRDRAPASPASDPEGPTQRLQT